MSGEMTELAKAAFYVTDIQAGRTGSFKIEEEGWGCGDSQRCYKEIHAVLLTLRDDGWKEDKLLAQTAPYTHNIRRAVLWKKFSFGKRWVTVILAERFGIDCTFNALDKKPWNSGTD